MSPQDQNILDAINLLSLLFRARKQKLPKLSDEEQHTLTVTKEHLAGADISIPVFLNTLKTLNGKGYLTSIGIFENEYHDKIREVFEEKKYNSIIQELSKHSLNNLPAEQKEAIAEELRRMAPPNVEVDTDSIIDQEINLTDFLDEGRKVFADHKDDDVAVVLLVPFRDIDTLLEKMNAGESFDEIQDSCVWYDPEKYEFHVGEDVVSTAYQAKPNVEHDVLSRLVEDLDEGVIWFDDIEHRTPRSLKDALLKFVDKNDKLKEVFAVHHDRLEFDKEAFR